MKRFTIYPLYFQQRSPDPDENYTALLPFYGHLQHRLFRDKIFFGDVSDLQPDPQAGRGHGQLSLSDSSMCGAATACGAGKFWPLVGNEHKDVTIADQRVSGTIAIIRRPR